MTRLGWVSIALGVLALLLGLLAWARQQAAQAEHDDALSHVRAGRYAAARGTLERAYRGDPGARGGEVALALGMCERGLGRPERAVEIWRGIPANAPFAGKAALLLARHELAGHRFAAAEPWLKRALREPGRAGLEARQTLAHIWKIQGRFDEVIGLFEASVGPGEEGLAGLRELYRLRAEPYPAHEFEVVLAEAGRAAPEDPLLKLGFGRMALQKGRVDEAGAWIDEGLARLPGEAALVRARLDAYRLAGNRRGALELLSRSQRSILDINALMRMCAWIARCERREERERVWLLRLVEAGAARGEEFERLAELAVGGGRMGEAREWREKKARYDAALPRYRELLFAPTALGHSEELARLAKELGWRFEASVHASNARLRAASSAAREWVASVVGQERARAEGWSQEAWAELARAWESVGVEEAARVAGTRAGESEDRLIPRFADGSAASGLRFRFERGQTEARQLPETMSGGVGLLDYDNDGWMDVYVVQGGLFPPRGDARSEDVLFRNNGDGTFTDASAAAGLRGMQGGYGHGVAIGDVNNDGYQDVFVTRYRSYALYVNRRGEGFEDVTEAWGLGGDRGWPSSAVLADLDGDGDVDLYVCHYVRWDERNPRVCRDPVRGRVVYCPPERCEGEADRLYRNDGSVFVEVGLEAGIGGFALRGLGVAAGDLDDDGQLDLFVANDMNPNLFFRNLGGLRFEERAAWSGLASNADGGYLAGMGIGAGDLDGDGRLDLAVTNFYGESTRFYHNLGVGQFADHSAAIGLAAASRYRLGFGIALADLNNDGYLDILTANGHVDDLRPLLPFTMPAQLLVGSAGGLWDATERAGAAVAAERLGRGLAVGDLDNDGLLDAVLVDQMGDLVYLHNETEPRGGFAMLALEGRASGRDAIGARVRVEAGGRAWTTWKVGGGSYQSSHDPRLHVGLGGVEGGLDVEVRWPSGRVDRHSGLESSRGYRLVEGEAEVASLPGLGARRAGGGD